jgi:DNA-binding Lrp family transcriptional regulator
MRRRGRMNGEEKIDAYVFFQGATQDFLNGLIGLVQENVEPAIRYAAVLTGNVDGVAALEVDDFAGLEALIWERFRTNPTTSTAIGLRPPPPRESRMPKANPGQPPIEAFVRVWVQPGRAQNVVDDLLDSGIDEAGVVAGDFDVLTVVEAETLQEFTARLLFVVHRIPSIVRTSTSFVTRSARRPDPEQA